MTYTVNAQQTSQALSDQLSNLTSQLGKASGAAVSALRSQIATVERLLEERRQRQIEERRLVCAQLHASWCETRDAIDSARKARQAMRKAHPGLVIPEPLDLPQEPANTGDPEDLRPALENIRQLQVEEAAEFDRALKSYLDRAASEKAVLQWFSTFTASGARSVDDVLATIEVVNDAALEAARRDRLTRYAELARRAIESELKSARTRKDVQLPEGLLGNLDAVFNAADEQSAADAYLKLERSISTFFEQQRELDRRLREKEATQAQKNRETDMRTVAQALSYTLDSLGYATNGISDSAFAERGELFAIDEQWAEHAVRFSFEPGTGRVTAAAVRIGQPADAQTATTATRAEDQSFDQYWCSPEGLGKVRQELERRGINAQFEREHRAGSVDLDVIEATESLESLRSTSRSRAGRALRQRQRE